VLLDAAVGRGLRRLANRQPLLLIEPRRAIMQGHRHAIEGVVEGDFLPDRIERIEQASCALVL